MSKNKKFEIEYTINFSGTTTNRFMHTVIHNMIKAMLNSFYKNKQLHIKVDCKELK